MSSLTISDKSIFKSILLMNDTSSMYELNAFDDDDEIKMIFTETDNKGIIVSKYCENGKSFKVNIQDFWNKENDVTVGKVMQGCIELIENKFNTSPRILSIKYKFSFFSLKEIREKNSEEIYEKTFENLSKLIKNCHLIINKLLDKSLHFCQELENFANKFDLGQLNILINLIYDSINKYPTEAIGKSKELIETCCKFMVKKLKIELKKPNNPDFPDLISKVLARLNLVPSAISNETKGREKIKGLLTNLSQIAFQVNDLRNDYGSGHGKSPDFKGLSIPHAKLVVGATLTFLSFLIEIYEEETLN